MSAVAKVYPNATQRIGQKAENWSTTGTQDTLKVGLIAPTANAYTWNGTSQGHKFVSDFLAGSGAGVQTEVSTSGTNYARQALTSVTFTTTGLVNTLTCATISWTATANFSATYAFFYDETDSSATDATRELICYWDFGGTVSVVSGGNFTLTINASGLVTYTTT
jgi:hypothetical protein